MAKLPPMNLPGPAVPWGREVQRVAQSNEALTGRLDRNNSQNVDGINTTKGIALDVTPILLPIQNSTLAPGVVTGVTAVQDWAWDLFKNGSSKLTVAWNPVSTSTDAQPMTILHYEVWIRPDGADTTSILAGTTPQHTLDVVQLPTNVPYQVKVRAVSIHGVPGEFSDETLAPAPEALLAITAPTQPTLETGYGIVVVRWDGLLADGTPLPVHFDYVQAQIAELAAGPWEDFGTRLRGKGSVQEANLPADATRFFRLVPFDKFGNAGAASAAVEIVVQGVDLGTLDQDLADLRTDLDTAAADIEVALAGEIDGARIIAQTIVGSKILANTITAAEIAAEAITAEQIAAETITALQIKARSIEGDRLVGGSVGVNEIDPAIGGVINLSANEEFNVIIGRIDTNSETVDAIGGTVDEMTTFYQFGPDGATITTPDSPFAVRLTNSRIEMLEQGVATSWWENQEMHVKSLIGEIVQLGNHQLEKYGTGTVVRKL